MLVAEAVVLAVGVIMLVGHATWRWARSAWLRPRVRAAKAAVPRTLAGSEASPSLPWLPLREAVRVFADEFTYRRYRRWSDMLVLLAWSVVEGIGYRQLTVAWRLRGLWRYLRGRTEWGAMSRRGFGIPAQRRSPSQATQPDVSAATLGPVGRAQRTAVDAIGDGGS